MKIIAETAYNHNGDVDYLIELIYAAKNSGADYVTVQIMDTADFCVKDYKRYQTYIENEISKSDWKKVFKACSDIKIDLIPCALDENSFDFCLEEGYRLFKVHATDITNKYFLHKIAQNTCEVILETQCASNIDIRFALDILGENVICLIHGFSDYPTEFEDLNLNALDSMKAEYDNDVGFADHTLDTIGIPLMCLSKNIGFLEKHITLSRQKRNFDWQVSLYPEQFSSMVSNINHYKRSLGSGIKHPSKRELEYRSVLYKKITKEKNKMLRADYGDDYIGNSFNNFKKEDVGVAVIARLKSQRLKEKILKPFYHNEIIVDLCDRVALSKYPVVLATSDLEEDNRLIDICIENDIEYFRGHPVSVLDRMLLLAYKNKWGGIFRVTGDNPYTDPKLMNDMVDIYKENNLDYVRVNGLPFGTTAELYSVSYLWRLYLKMKNPLQSEYLSWFILQDNKCRRGCIDFADTGNIKYVNLSIDYQKDYDNCIELSKKINKSELKDVIIKNICENIKLDDIDTNKEIKLPDKVSISLEKYLEIINNSSYIVRKKEKIGL